jgi:hypothetical protein
LENTKAMIKSEEIIIKVSSDIAQVYNQATKEEQEQMQFKIAALMRSQIAYSQSTNLARFRQTMDSASQEAQSQGLTPEILGSILSGNND